MGDKSNTNIGDWANMIRLITIVITRVINRNTVLTKQLYLYTKIARKVGVIINA